ncbi:MAG TPA: zf-HC2 domain-containing protein [Candidatus Angelobacter sp.]|nr:zf-HC2 domain-containing protein [Candidatus Angelobacter sp.]
MRCTEARPLLPLYLDGAVTGGEMHAVTEHIGECATCQSEYNSMESTRLLVSSLGRKQAPPDLALKIRVAVSRERSRSLRGLLMSYFVRLENTLNAFMFPATAGIFTAVLFFGVITGFFVPVQIGADDVPTNLFIPPKLAPPSLEVSAYDDGRVSLDSSVVIETYVDAAGRVENYHIISGQDDDAVRSYLNRALLFTIFAPAQSFGRPVPGKAVISFSRVNVKG